MNNFVEKYQEPWRAEFWIFGLKTTYDIADDDTNDDTDDDTDNDTTYDSTEIVSQDERISKWKIVFPGAENLAQA